MPPAKALRPAERAISSPSWQCTSSLHLSQLSQARRQPSRILARSAIRRAGNTFFRRGRQWLLDGVPDEDVTPFESLPQPRPRATERGGSTNPHLPTISESFLLSDSSSQSEPSWGGMPILP